MREDINQPFPKQYNTIVEETKAAGFTMASDVLTGSLLRTLAASKPGCSFLELGTGTGLSTSWILNGMDAQSTLISIDNDPRFLKIAKENLGNDVRLQLIQTDGEDWVQNNKNAQFDFIFADTWHGKYLLLDEVLLMLKKGGFYIIDDMLPQSNWPDGHDKKVEDLILKLEGREDLIITKQAWASGILIAVKR